MRRVRSRLVVLGHVLASIVMVKGIALVDWATGSEISLSVFYLAPVAYIVCRAGRLFGILLAVISAVAWLVADTAAGHMCSSPLIPYWNATVRLGFFLIVASLLARLRQALDSEWSLSRLDPLTGAANSRYFDEVAGAEIERTRRHGHPLTLAYVDLDNFKQVNDTQGHSAGDAVLRAVARVIQENLRASDTLARLGGDEFAILLPEAPYEGARALLDRVRAQLLAAMRQHGWPVTFSIGAVTSTGSFASVDEMIGKADGLMYAVKRSSKDMIRHELLDAAPAAAMEVFR